MWSELSFFFLLDLNIDPSLPGPWKMGERIPPSELQQYRLIHEFRYPNYLYSVHEYPNHFTESAVFMSDLALFLASKLQHVLAAFTNTGVCIFL
jgi:hypothetical protein